MSAIGFPHNTTYLLAFDTAFDTANQAAFSTPFLSTVVVSFESTIFYTYC